MIFESSSGPRETAGQPNHALEATAYISRVAPFDVVRMLLPFLHDSSHLIGRASAWTR